MVPIFFIYCCNYVAPAALIDFVASLLPSAHPYYSIYYGMLVCFLPVGIKIMVLAPKDLYDNIIPRNMGLPDGILKRGFPGVSGEWLTRVQSSHDNILEHWAFVAAGVVACVTSGVPLELVSAIATYWNVVTALYLLAFL